MLMSVRCGTALAELGPVPPDVPFAWKRRSRRRTQAFRLKVAVTHPALMEIRPVPFAGIAYHIYYDSVTLIADRPERAWPDVQTVGAHYQMVASDGCVKWEIWSNEA